MPTAEVVLSRKQFDVGQQFTVEQLVTEELIQAFAVVSRDRNPLHLDPDYARQTRFRERIAHGMIGGGLISAALASMGGEDATIVYLEQRLKFHDSVGIGDMLKATVEIIGVNGKILDVETICKNQLDKLVISGQARVMADPYPFRQKLKAAS